MVNEQLRERIGAISEQALIYDGPSFDNSIIGITPTGKLVYDYDKMSDEFAQDNNENFDTLSEEEKSEAILEAIEFIDYNTIRATPYMGPNAPIVVAQDVTNDENVWINLIDGEPIEECWDKLQQEDQCPSCQ